MSGHPPTFTGSTSEAPEEPNFLETLGALNQDQAPHISLRHQLSKSDLKCQAARKDKVSGSQVDVAAQNFYGVPVKLSLPSLLRDLSCPIVGPVRTGAEPQPASTDSKAAVVGESLNLPAVTFQAVTAQPTEPPVAGTGSPATTAAQEAPDPLQAIAIPGQAVAGDKVKVDVEATLQKSSEEETTSSSPDAAAAFSAGPSGRSLTAAVGSGSLPVLTSSEAQAAIAPNRFHGKPVPAMKNEAEASGSGQSAASHSDLNVSARAPQKVTSLVSGDGSLAAAMFPNKTAQIENSTNANPTPLKAASRSASPAYTGTTSQATEKAAPGLIVEISPIDLQPSSADDTTSSDGSLSGLTGHLPTVRDPGKVDSSDAHQNSGADERSVPLAITPVPNEAPTRPLSATAAGVGSEGTHTASFSSEIELAVQAHTQLLHSIRGSELQVNLTSEELGRISVRAGLVRNEISAQISVESSQLGMTLLSHVPAVEQKIYGEHGVLSSITVSTLTPSASSGGHAEPDHRSRDASGKLTSSAKGGGRSLGLSVDSAPSLTLLPMGKSGRLNIHI